jgi:hypothetical protein
MKVTGMYLGFSADNFLDNFRIKKLKKQVAHACNLRYSGGRGRRIMV